MLYLNNQVGLSLWSFPGLNLTKKEYLGKLMILEHLKLNLTTLRAKIFEKVTEKLESVEITAEVLLYSKTTAHN